MSDHHERLGPDPVDAEREFRVCVAVLGLRALVEEGMTLEEITRGEAGRRWIEEMCGGDRELAAEGLELVYPGTPVPWAPQGTLF